MMRTFHTLTHGVMWNELDRNYRCFRQQDVEVSIFELLDCLADDEQVTLLTPVDYCNIVRNISLHDTRRTNFVLSEELIWTKYLQYALQKMYDVSNEIDEEKDAVKEVLAVAEAKLASTDIELAEAHDFSRSSRATAVTTTSNRSEHLGRADQNIPHRGAKGSR